VTEQHFVLDTVPLLTPS